MNSRLKTHQLLLLILGIGGVIVSPLWMLLAGKINEPSPAVLSHPVQIFDDGQTIEYEAQQDLARPDVPARIIIPTLRIDTMVESLGLTSSGAMATPENPTSTSWYNLGPRPGETGSAVIAGHFGWKDSQIAVFDSLHLIKIGDVIFIDTAAGNRSTFMVKKLQNLDWDEDADSAFTSSDGQAKLNLITGEGNGSSDDQRYPQRLVVFSDLVTDEEIVSVIPID